MENAKDRPGGLDELENRSGLWEGPAEGGGGRRGKEPEWKMGRTGRGDQRVNNRGGKCEGPAGGNRQVKEPEWEMPRTGRGIDKLKNRSGKCQGPAGGNRQVKEPEWEMRRIGLGGSTS